MSTIPAQPASPWSTWLPRIRFWLALLIVWGVVQFFVGPLLLPHGIDAPYALVAGPYDLVSPLFFAIFYALAVAAAGLICSSHDVRGPLLAVSVALGAWLMSAGQDTGTMDDWLARRQPDPAAAAGSGPYLVLLFELVLLALAAAAGYWLLARLSERSEKPHSGARAAEPPELQQGLLTLLIATAVGGVAVSILVGPMLEWTRRGQVFFAVAVGLIAGVYVARSVTDVRHPLWYLPVPLVLALVGLITAAVSPTLLIPSDIDHLNTVPAWPLARPLPLEWLAAGVFGALFLLSDDSDSETQAEAR